MSFHQQGESTQVFRIIPLLMQNASSVAIRIHPRHSTISRASDSELSWAFQKDGVKSLAGYDFRLEQEYASGLLMLVDILSVPRRMKQPQTRRNWQGAFALSMRNSLSRMKTPCNFSVVCMAICYWETVEIKGEKETQLAVHEHSLLICVVGSCT